MVLTYTAKGLFCISSSTLKVKIVSLSVFQHLGPKKLEELYVDLKLHDAEEGKLKALKAEKNGDLDGEKEASVRKAFLGTVGEVTPLFCQSTCTL